MGRVPAQRSRQAMGWHSHARQGVLGRCLAVGIRFGRAHPSLGSRTVADGGCIVRVLDILVAKHG